MKLFLKFGEDYVDATGDHEFVVWARDQWLELRNCIARKQYRNFLLSRQDALWAEEKQVNGRKAQIVEEMKYLTNKLRA